jgi:hypothetical protein
MQVKNHHASKIKFIKLLTRSMMMKAIESVTQENVNLLLEIVELKAKVSQLYNLYGPGSSEYISLTLKLNQLINEYIDEKIVHLV